MAFHNLSLRLCVALLITAGLLLAPVLSVSSLWSDAKHLASASQGDCCPGPGDADRSKDNVPGKGTSDDVPPGECEHCVHLCAGCGKSMLAMSPMLSVTYLTEADHSVVEPPRMSGSSHLADLLKPPQA